MTEIYLIRHAEAEGNIFRRIHGHYNSLLTPEGFARRRLWANALKMSLWTAALPVT